MKLQYGLLIFVVVGTATAASAANIADDIVFAHNFENISGNTIASLAGPDATKDSNQSADTNGPIGLFPSQQHLQAPSSGFNHVDTNTRLTMPTSAMSFSIFYNNRGDSGNARLLTSFNGTGGSNGEFLFDSIGPRLRFAMGFNNSFPQFFSTVNVPEADGVWHQAGFVFEGGDADGVVKFYFDGQQFGDAITIANATEIPVQNLNWFLLEDATGISNTTEFFSDGDYDEAALWTRALSSEEMNDLYTKGLGQIPEPSSLAVILGIGSIVLVRRRMA